MDYLLLGLVALGILFSGVIALGLALGHRTRLHVLGQRVERLEAELAIIRRSGGVDPATSLGSSPSETKAQAPDDQPAAAPVAQTATPEDQDTAAPTAPPPSGYSSPADRPDRSDRPGIEERLGTRWAVWVGGLALGLGGLLLVRYSIEEGYFGPAARVLMGAAFGLALVGGAEWLRRRDGRSAFAGVPSAHVPAILTAAGTASLFGVAYAAYALYGFLSPAAAFVLLGLIALATMTAAALHGPALAAFGLFGAYAAPALVSSSDPQAWPLVIYLVFVVVAAYGLASLRLWAWLARGATLGAMGWMMLMGVAGERFALANAVFVLAVTMLAALILFARTYRGQPEEEARQDPLVLPIMGGLAGFMVYALIGRFDGSTIILLAGLATAVHLALALSTASASLASLFAAGTVAGALFVWPVSRLAQAEPVTVLPFDGQAPWPDALVAYLAFATIAPIAIMALAVWRIMRGARLSTDAAWPYAATAAIAPLAAVVVAYWRVANFAPSVPLAVAAGALAALLVLAAGFLRAMDAQAKHEPARIAAGLLACGAIAALAIGVTILFEAGTLTVALALGSLAAAWLSDRLGLPQLRYAAGVAALVTLGRYAYDPSIAMGDLRNSWPILNGITLAYGLPAIAFWTGAQIMARRQRDLTTRLAEAASFIAATLFAVFTVRHAIYGDPLAPTTDLVEIGLTVTIGAAFSLAMVLLDRARSDRLYRLASLLYGAWTFILGFLGLLIFENPAFTGSPVAGGTIVNSLIPAYLMPTIAVAALALRARGARPRWYVRLALILALGLKLAYVLLAIRRVFQGPDLSLALGTQTVELWTYSAALIAMGVAFLGYGLLRNNVAARLISGLYLVAAILKVFIVDLSELDGIWRALSFIGLGLTLVGIGLAYQKLLRGAGSRRA